MSNKLPLVAAILLALGASAANAFDRDPVTEIDSWNAALSLADRDAKYCKMVVSPFIFYRGSNHLFWHDFANDPRIANFGNGDTQTWIQGDLHAYNFGSYDNDNGDVVYGLNDFDESVVADYQYDVWRMAVSLVLIARENNNLSSSEQQAMVDAFSEHYLDTLADVHGNNDELDAIYTKDNTYGRLDDFLDDVESGESRRKMLDKWTNEVDGVRQFDLSYEKLGEASAAERVQIEAAMAAYGQSLSGGIDYDNNFFAVKDVARRLLAGTGSLGTPRFYVLIEGASGSEDDDRILDVKRQGHPTPYHYLGSAFTTWYDANFPNPAVRHAIAYKALDIHVDDLLGWMILSDGDYSVRERSPFKDSFDTTELTSDTRYNKLAEQWGAILAMQHARADKDYNAGYVPASFDKEVDEATDTHHSEFRAQVRDIAFSYADQVEADYQAFVAAYGSICN
ncbi:DUF2252 domain-containing protein [Endothiovibrio diazotrophicus]